MSRSVDLFIAHQGDLAELAARLVAITGLEMTADEPEGSYVFTGDKRTAVLYRHTFVDDGDLKLSAYPMVFSQSVGFDDHPGLSSETYFARMVSEQLAPTRSLLVVDLQSRAPRAGTGRGPASASGRPSAPGPGQPDPQPGGGQPQEEPPATDRRAGEGA